MKIIQSGVAGSQIVVAYEQGVQGLEVFAFSVVAVAMSVRGLQSFTKLALTGLNFHFGRGAGY